MKVLLQTNWRNGRIKVWAEQELIGEVPTTSEEQDRDFRFGKHFWEKRQERSKVLTQAALGLESVLKRLGFEVGLEHLT